MKSPPSHECSFKAKRLFLLVLPNVGTMVSTCPPCMPGTATDTDAEEALRTFAWDSHYWFYVYSGEILHVSSSSWLYI